MGLNETRQKIQSAFGSTPWIDKCLSLFDHVTSAEHDPDQRIGYADIQNITKSDEMSADLIGATNALTNSGVFDCGAVFSDGTGAEFEITGQELSGLWAENKLSHPKTGEPVEEPQNKTYMFFRLTPEFAEKISTPTLTP